MSEKVSKTGMKRTIAIAIAGAFGLLFALIGIDIIIGLRDMAGLNVDKFENVSVLSWRLW